MRRVAWRRVVVLAAGLAAASLVAESAKPVPLDSRGRPVYEQGAVAVKLRSGVSPSAPPIKWASGMPSSRIVAFAPSWSTVTCGSGWAAGS